LSAGRRAFTLLAAAALAACSIEARSTGFECASQSDCPEGRVCVSSWCVLSGGGDGGVPAGDASGAGDASARSDAAIAECSEAVCDRCEEGTCVLLCTSSGACAGGVECPPGMPCHVICSGVGSCGGGVDCTQATDCTIDCAKSEACAGPVVCGSGRCDVGCTARQTCVFGIDCSESCACTTDCSGSGACELAPECPDDQCVAVDGDCTSGVGCDLCQ